MKPTKKEIETLLADGLSQREIAEKLQSTQTTIGRYMRKYGLVANRRKGPRAGSKPHLCKGCGETDPAKFRKQWFSTSYSKCKACHAKAQADKLRTNRGEAIKLKGGKCCICGYAKHHGSLHFHHLDPAQKDPKWKSLKHKPIDEIMAELNKCCLVCANCHGEIHAGVTAPPGYSPKKMRLGPK